jgi:hypothetical protein
MGPFSWSCLSRLVIAVVFFRLFLFKFH